jgi:4-hydroxybenzoate polyprenyltransferase
MYRADALKERLGWLKVVFGAFLLVDAPLIAWTAQNFWSARPVLLVLAALGIVAATAGIVFTNHRANRAIAELETL